MNKENIVAIIPARKGSKGIKNKNIIKINKKPLIAYSILTAKKCNLDKIIVTTNSKNYQKISKKYGAETPFLRPNNISNSKSLDQDYLRHCYFWFLRKNYKIDIFVILRPTTPIRDFKEIKKILNFFKKNNLNFLRSAHESAESPFKWFKRDKKGYFLPLSKNLSLKTTNQRRQDFEKVYIPNGYIDILRTKFMNNQNIYGKKMYVYKTKKTLEIDNMEDYNLIKKLKIDV